MTGGAILGACMVAFAVSLIVCLIVGAMASLGRDEPADQAMTEHGHRAVAWASAFGVVCMLAALVMEGAGR